MNSQRKVTAKVVMYSKVPCAFCVRAKNFFNANNIPFEEIDLTDNWDEINRLKQETGWATIPIILINDKVIGGYEDVKRLSDEGRLDELLYS